MKASKDGWYVRATYQNGETSTYGCANPTDRASCLVYAARLLLDPDMSVRGVEIVFIREGQEAPR